MWREVTVLDPSCLHAQVHVAAAAAAEALRQRDAGASDLQSLVHNAISLLESGLKRCEEYRERMPQRYGLLGPQYEPLMRACLHVNLGLVFDFGLGDTVAACPHYEQAAHLDGRDRRVWQLWASAAIRDPSLADDAARNGVAAAVHELAVRRGLWLRPEQRPLQMLNELAAEAAPWLDELATRHPACVALKAHFEEIRAEGMALLQHGAKAFESSRSDASARGLALLTAGGGGLPGTAGEDAANVGPASAALEQRAAAASSQLNPSGWKDVTLYVNGRRHEANCQRCPRTAALLCGDEGDLLRDASSCPLGSAFFSLLQPGTRLRPHCGPTNARLRAHLALVVPPGDNCKMRVGNAPARRWVEGELLLFDDSFEHEVWNNSPLPRLVLIVDMWHPDLQTDTSRVAALDPERAERYRRAAHEGHFEPAPLPSGAPKAADLEAAAKTENSGVARLCAGLHDAPLGGDVGARQVAGSLSHFLQLHASTSHAAQDIDAEDEARLAQGVLEALQKSGLALTTDVPVAVAAPVAMLGTVSPTPEVSAVEVETVVQGAECYWLHGALSPPEQASLFEFIKDHDRTDWDNLPVCMNPTPKTLQLADGVGGATSPTLTFKCRTETDAFVGEAVCRVARILRRRSLLLADRTPPEPVSFSLAAIRYPSPDGKFPRHIDHCNDESAVFLFSLGCHARFRVEAPTTEGSSSLLELELRSGDVLAFNPSTRAAIMHAVTGIGGEGSCPAALSERFHELRKFRYGIQCRVHFE